MSKRLFTLVSALAALSACGFSAYENYLEAVKAFESVPQVRELRPLLVAHPRAEKQGASWLQMEWINYIHGARPSLTPKRSTMVTRLKPEKESEYRLLHQSTWPATVDRMTRMEYHDFSVFLVADGQGF